MPKPPFQATAEGLPTRRQFLTGLTVATLAVAISPSIGSTAPIAMPDDLPAYMVGRWPALSRTQREIVANGWSAMEVETRAVVEAWCRLDDADKEGVMKALRS